MLRLFPLKVRLAVALVPIIGIAAVAPVTSIASCVPPQLRPFADEPGTVVFAGTVRKTNALQVALDVQVWWGVDPRPAVAVQRPAIDPTVISSTDWDPKPGEQWVVLARQHAGALHTGVCEQMPATAVSVGEVESSLGPGVVPSATEPATGGATADPGLPGWAPFVGVGLLAGLAVAAVVALNRRRRDVGAVDAR